MAERTNSRVAWWGLKKKAKAADSPPVLEPTPWNADWELYFKEADSIAEHQFIFLVNLIGKDRFDQFDLGEVLDFACGHGRMAEQFARYARKIICCDIQPSAVEFCRTRFADKRPGCDFDFICNTLSGIPLPDESVTFIYSWDAMVHFDYWLLKRYFREFKRILRPGGQGLIHHSNYKGIVPGANKIWNENPHCRASVSARGVNKMIKGMGMKVVSQHPMIWAYDQNLDCVTIFQKHP